MSPGRPRLVLVWLAAAVGFGTLLVLAELSRSPLDDPDPARQRPGFLDAGALPEPAAALAPGVPRVGRRSVVFFVRQGDIGALCETIAAATVQKRADLVIVVPRGGRCAAMQVIDDPDARLARAYGLPEPRDGRNAVGYAVVDRQGLIRYRTLDPAVVDDVREVATIVNAIP